MYLFTIRLDEFVLDIVAEDAESALTHIHRRFNIINPPKILRTEFIEDLEEDEYIKKAITVDE